MLNDFTKSKWGELSKKLSPLNGIKAFLKARTKDYSLSFQYPDVPEIRRKLNIGQYHKKVEFQVKDNCYILNDLYLGKHSPPKFQGSVSFIHTKGYSRKALLYYRLIIPLSEKINFAYTVQGYRSFISTKAEINGNPIFAYAITQKPQYFLIIESETKENFEQFSDKAFALKNALGYLTGHLAGNMGYYFAYRTKKMQFPNYLYICGFRDSIISGYVPIYSNPFGYIRKRTTAEKYYKSKVLRKMNTEELSTFCQKLHDSIDFTSAIILLLESSIASLLFMPGGFAIVLESLADIIIGKRKFKMAPMKPALSKKVRKGCLEVITKHSAVISKDNFKALQDRIGWLNQTTNKARLKAPFDLLGIKLLQEDLDIIDTRNDFLHGRIPDITGAGDTRSIDRKNKDLYYASMRFYTLLSVLILKWIGYNNKVVNFPKIHESYCRIKLKEEHYRQI